MTHRRRSREGFCGVARNRHKFIAVAVFADCHTPDIWLKFPATKREISASFV